MDSGEVLGMRKDSALGHTPLTLQGLIPHKVCNDGVPSFLSSLPGPDGTPQLLLTYISLRETRVAAGLMSPGGKQIMKKQMRQCYLLTQTISFKNSIRVSLLRCFDL